MCDTILYTWFGKKWKRLKKFWGWKICLVYAYFFKHLSLSMLISLMLIKKKSVWQSCLPQTVFSAILCSTFHVQFSVLSCPGIMCDIRVTPHCHFCITKEACFGKILSRNCSSGCSWSIYYRTCFFCFTFKPWQTTLVVLWWTVLW